MAINLRSFSGNISSYSISTISADILIRGGDDSDVLVKCGNNVKVSNIEGSHTLSITEEQNRTSRIVSGNLNVSNLGISVNGCTFSDNSCLIRNYNGSSVEPNINSDSTQVEIFIPKSSRLPELTIETTSGNVSIRELFLKRLLVRVKTGNVNLNAFNSILTEIYTKTGNISAEIFESMFNYEYSLNTKLGTTSDRYDDDEPKKAILLPESYLFKANSETGNIDLLFKGRRL